MKEGETKHLTVGVTGMTCAACSTRVEKVLNKMDGVEAQVNLTTEKASINYDPEVTTVDDITSKIEKIGYGVQTDRAEFDVFGMTCAACSSRIEKVLNKQEGIELATVNLANETATIEYNPGLIGESGVIDVIKRLGYDAKERANKEEKQSQKDKQIKHMQIKLMISVILSALYSSRCWIIC